MMGGTSFGQGVLGCADKEKGKKGARGLSMYSCFPL